MFVAPEMLDEDSAADLIVDQVVAPDADGPVYHRVSG